MNIIQTLKTEAVLPMNLRPEELHRKARTRVEKYLMEKLRMERNCA